MKALIKKYKHGWILSYFFVYVTWFFILGNMDVHYNVIETVFDKYIPFSEIFIVPYFLWFPYIPIVVGYFFLTSKTEFYRICAFLFVGMTIALISYTVYPTIVTFRPDLNALGRDNIFLDACKFIYNIDPGTNVCPSIHCYNAIGLWIAISRSPKLSEYRWIQTGSLILSVSICLSTVMIKQHSLIDAAWAVIMAVVMYLIVYLPPMIKSRNMFKLKRRLLV